MRSHTPFKVWETFKTRLTWVHDIEQARLGFETGSSLEPGLHMRQGSGPLESINMEGEDDFEVEYSTEELVQLVQDGEHVLDSMEEDPLIVDSSDDESKVVKLSNAQKYAKDVLNFMASQGSQIFNTEGC